MAPAHRLSFAAFFMDVSIGLVSLGLPLWALELGASSSQLGIIGASLRVPTVLFCLNFGRLSDGIGRKYLTIIACCWLALFYGFTSLAASILLLTIFAFCIGTGLSLFWPAVQAWIGDLSEDNSTIGKSTSRFNASWSTGAMLGNLLAGVFFQIRSGMPFLIAALVVSFIILILVKMPICTPRGSAGSSKPVVLLPAAHQSFLNTGLLNNFAIWSAMGSVLNLFPELASTRYNLSPALISSLIMCVGLARTMAFWGLGYWQGWQYNPRPTIYSLYLAAAGLLIIGFSNSVLIIALCFLLVGTVQALTFNASLFYALNSPDRVGEKTARHEISTVGGIMTGAFIGGFLAQSFGLKAPYFFSAAIVVFAILTCIYHFQYKKTAGYLPISID